MPRFIPQPLFPAKRVGERTFLTCAGQQYQAMDYRIDPDVSAACYFYAIRPLLNIPVTVSHVHFDSMQGDAAFIRVLKKMVNGYYLQQDFGISTPFRYCRGLFPIGANLSRQFW